MPRRSEPTERMCAVTRQVKPVAELLRFVLDPDGTIVPDLRQVLPGRGVWVSATASAVGEAERRRLFAVALKTPAKVAPGLADRVADLIAQRALGALSLARKAGEVVLGAAKIEAAIGAGKVVALLHASEAGADGVRRLDGAFRRRRGSTAPTFRLFTEAQLDLALGRPHVIHAALLAGRASENVLDRIAALVRFLEVEPQGGIELHLSTPAAGLSAGLTTV